MAYSDQHCMADIDLVECCPVGATFVDRDLLRRTIRCHRLAEEALRCRHVALGPQQEVDAFALLDDSTVEIFQTPFTLMYV